MTIRNGFRLARRALGAARARQRFPYKMTFVATERCNLRCGICRIWETGGDGMALAEIREFFTRSNRFSWIDVTGGEIFLRDDLLDVFAVILAECRELAILHFPTNGYLVERILEVTRELLRMRPPRLVVTVSIDGPPEVHDALRGAEGSFDRAVETYARLRKLPGCAPVLGMTLSSGNAGTIEETLAAVRRREPRVTSADLHVNLPGGSEHYYRNGDVPPTPRESLARELCSVRRGKRVPVKPIELLELRLLSLGEQFLRTGKCPIPCQALSASCFVGASGAVYPCVTWNRHLGTLGESGYDMETLWNAPAAVEARKEIAAGRCPHCWTACEAVPSIAARWGTLRP